MQAVRRQIGRCHLLTISEGSADSRYTAGFRFRLHRSSVGALIHAHDEPKSRERSIALVSLASGAWFAQLWSAFRPGHSQSGGVPSAEFRLARSFHFAYLYDTSVARSDSSLASGEVSSRVQWLRSGGTPSRVRWRWSSCAFSRTPRSPLPLPGRRGHRCCPRRRLCRKSGCPRCPLCGHRGYRRCPLCGNSRPRDRSSRRSPLCRSSRCRRWCCRSYRRYPLCRNSRWRRCSCPCRSCHRCPLCRSSRCRRYRRCRSSRCRRCRNCRRCRTSRCRRCRRCRNCRRCRTSRCRRCRRSRNCRRCWTSRCRRCRRSRNCRRCLPCPPSRFLGSRSCLERSCWRNASPRPPGSTVSGFPFLSFLFCLSVLSPRRVSPFPDAWSLKPSLHGSSSVNPSSTRTPSMAIVSRSSTRRALGQLRSPAGMSMVVTTGSQLRDEQNAMQLPGTGETEAETQAGMCCFTEWRPA